MRLHSQSLNEGQIKDAEVLTLVETRMIEPGTAMTFYQATAPTGWTKDTTAALNNAALRLTTGSGGGTGGANNFTQTFGTSRATASTVLTESQIPSHTHSLTFSSSTYFSDTTSGVSPGPNGADQDYTDETFPSSTNSTGGGTGHTHSLTFMDLKYVNFIICSRDAV